MKFYLSDKKIIGLDEAGRGPLCGPVVAAAISFHNREFDYSLINDSKKISSNIREQLYKTITKNCHVGVGIVEADEIDQINILNATKKAMVLAVQNLINVNNNLKDSHIIIDGNMTPAELAQNAEYIIKGDGIYLEIAAASIIAKVTRDRIMQQLSLKFPEYGWENNAGYGTKKHLDAIKLLGPTIHHRKSFAPIRNFII